MSKTPNSLKRKLDCLTTTTKKPKLNQFLKLKNQDFEEKFRCYKEKEVINRPSISKKLIVNEMDDDIDTDNEQLNYAVKKSKKQLIKALKSN